MLGDQTFLISRFKPRLWIISSKSSTFLPFSLTDTALKIKKTWLLKTLNTFKNVFQNFPCTLGRARPDRISSTQLFLKLWSPITEIPGSASPLSGCPKDLVLPPITLNEDQCLMKSSESHLSPHFFDHFCSNENYFHQMWKIISNIVSAFSGGRGTFNFTRHWSVFNMHVNQNRTEISTPESTATVFNDGINLPSQEYMPFKSREV